MIPRDGTRHLEVEKLWQEYREKKHSSIRDQLIENYLPLVKLVAGRIAISLPQHIDRDDLVSNGFFGLLDAIDRFDTGRNVKFETYAVARIRGSILDAIRAQDWLPATVRQKAKQYEQVLTVLENQLGRSATDHEIAAAMKVPIEQLHSLISQLNASTLVPIEEYLQVEAASGANMVNPSQAIEEEDVKQTLAKAIDKLPEKEKIVVTLYYYEGLTLKEISVTLQLSEARISQLHTKAVFRLRGALARIKSSLL